MPTGALELRTIQTPGEGSNLLVEGFLAECQRRGIKLTAQGGTIRATGKAPANPEKFAAFLKAKKPELLALLGTPKAGNLMTVPELGKSHDSASMLCDSLTVNEGSKGNPMLGPGQGNPMLGAPKAGNPMELSESGKSHGATTKLSSEASMLHSEAPTQGQYSVPNIALAALYPDRRQEVLTWALTEAARGLLPVNEVSISLPSGQCVPAHGGAVWLLEGQARAQEIQPAAEALQKGEAHARAFLVLRQDLRALAILCADAWHEVYQVIEVETTAEAEHTGAKAPKERTP